MELNFYWYIFFILKYSLKYKNTKATTKSYSGKFN